MTSGISAISASSNITTASFPGTTPVASPKAAAKLSDTVQLSDAAQQYLNAPKTATSDPRGIVMDLVLAAAAGDVGALSLLMVA
jgi:hypothetical protein